jgi:hypothetical protein
MKCAQARAGIGPNIISVWARSIAQTVSLYTTSIWVAISIAA